MSNWSTHQQPFTGSLSFVELHQFEESLERAINHHDFLTIFYIRFMQESDEIASFFDNVDIMKLKDKLAKTLMLSTMANLEPKKYQHQLEELGKYHQKMSIPKKLYSTWKDSIMEVAHLCDPEWNPELEKVWKKAMDVTIRIMFRGYN